MDTGGARWGEMLEFLALYKKHIMGKYTPTTIAPKRQALKIFGGPLTIEEFRKNKNQIWVHVPGDIHVIHTFTTREEKAKVSLSAEDAELRDALLLMVTRASDPEPGVQRLALEGLRREIRSATRHADLSLR